MGGLQDYYNITSQIFVFFGKKIFKHKGTKKPQRIMPKADPHLADTKKD
jgi:hypothetical protein